MTTAFLRLGPALLLIGALASCDDFKDHPQKSASAAKVASPIPVITPPAPAATPGVPVITPPAPVAAAAANPDLPPAGLAIDQAVPAKAQPAAKPAGYDPVLVRAEVLLDRAGFSPGAIDGRDGENLHRALQAFATAHGLASAGALDAPLWQALSQDGAPAMQTYVVTADDEAGPFIGAVPKDYRAMAKLPAMGFTDPRQELAERFHMDPKLLSALNPGVDFSQAGARLLVTAPRKAPREFQATRLEVDKTNEQVRAYAADGRLLAVYPASVGSAERPAPSGVFAVAAVAPRPAYYYDPARLTFTPEGATGKLKIAPGPNNPVGSTWIALTIPTYGIHGAPDPVLIGKRQSHGCVRLTNWDAAELGKAVKKGVSVSFVGQEAPLPARHRPRKS